MQKDPETKELERVTDIHTIEVINNKLFPINE